MLSVYECLIRGAEDAREARITLSAAQPLVDLVATAKADNRELAAYRQTLHEEAESRLGHLHLRPRHGATPI